MRKKKKGLCFGLWLMELHAGMNILICTPGRLLQHMDETPDFDASNVQILVLDEADRILDLVMPPCRSMERPS